MAISAQDMATAYPIAAYRYRVHVRGADGKDAELLCSAVSGLELGVETIEYKDGFGNVFQMPGQRQAINFTLRRGVFRKSSSLYDWFNTITLNAVEKKDITISLTDESGENPLVTWNVFDVFPNRLSPPSFDASSNEVAVEEISLTAARLTVEFN